MTKNIIMPVSKKGGIYKTTISRSLVEIFRYKKGLKTAVYDTDATTSSALTRAYGYHITKYDSDVKKIKREKDENPLTGVQRLDLRSGDRKTGRENILQSLDLDCEVVIIDTPADSISDIQKIADRGNSVNGLLDELESADCKLSLIFPINDEIECVHSAQAFMDLFGDRVNYFGMKVLYSDVSIQKKSDFFSYWDGYDSIVNGEKIRKYGNIKPDFEKLGGTELFMDFIEPTIKAELNDYSAKFSELIGLKPAIPCLERGSKRKLETWLDEMEEQADIMQKVWSK